MIIAILTVLASLIAWGIVDFAIDLAGKSVAARVVVGVLAIGTGAVVPYMVVEGLRTAFLGDED